MNVQMRIITEENVDSLMSMAYSDNIVKIVGDLVKMEPVKGVESDYISDYMKEYKKVVESILYKEKGKSVPQAIPRAEQLLNPIFSPSKMLRERKDDEGKTMLDDYGNILYAPLGDDYNSPQMAPVDEGYIPQDLESSPNSVTKEYLKILHDSNNTESPQYAPDGEGYIIPEGNESSPNSETKAYLKYYTIAIIMKVLSTHLIEKEMIVVHLTLHHLRR